MNTNFEYGKTFLKIGEKNITFTLNIRDVKQAGQFVVVLLEVPNGDDTLNNIYAYDLNGKLKWQVQPVTEKFSDLVNPLPYENMFCEDNKISASDFYGRKFWIDLETGKLLDFKASR